MARKDKKGRLFIPDVYVKAGELNSSNLLFALIDSKKIVIISQDKLKRLSQNNKIESLGNCTLFAENFKPYITIPKNVEKVLGKGKDYYFGIIYLNPGSIPVLRINK